MLIALALLTQRRRPGTACIRCAARTTCRAPATRASSRCSIRLPVRPGSAVCAKYQRAWGARSTRSAAHLVEMLKAAVAGRSRDVLHGENLPLRSQLNKVRQASRAWSSSPCRTSSSRRRRSSPTSSCRRARTGEARHVHEHRPARADRPPRCGCRAGRLDWEILCELSTRMAARMKYDSVEEIFAEFAG